MKVLITGGGGMLGQKLAKKIIEKNGKVNGDDSKTVDTIVLADVVAANKPESESITFEIVEADLTDSKQATDLIAKKCDVIYHLAGIVSGDAEQNFEKGYAVNVDGLKNLLEAIRQVEDYTPRFVFSSSAAVFGSPVPDMIPDTFHRTPRTSYGAQKAIGELLVDDYSRKGYVDGISLRFSSIAIRPGKPNKAATGFISGIIREPLVGEEVVCPVSRDLKHPMVSPRKAIEFLLHAATVSADDLKEGRAITMPAITASVGEMVDALEKIAGKETVEKIKWEKNEKVETMLSTWQFHFDCARAKKLGFTPNASYEEIVNSHIEDELGGAIHTAKKAKTTENGDAKE